MKFLVEPINQAARVENYEVSIINFAKAINRSIRKSDFAARIGRYEFVLALATSDKEAGEIVYRITELWRDEDFRFSYSSTPYLIGDGALSLLSRLDRSEVIHP